MTNFENTQAFHQAQQTLNRAWEHFSYAPEGHFKTLGIEYMKALDGFRTNEAIESDEFRTILDMLNTITEPDLYSRIRLTEKQAVEGLMLLKQAAWKLHEASRPPVPGIYDVPAFAP